MEDNYRSLISTLYQCLSERDGQGMADCYVRDAHFSDPVFNNLKNEEVGAMWKMLTGRAKTGITAAVHDININNDTGQARIEASYRFSQSNRLVTNHIHAQFTFRDGKIWKQRDEFDFWKWSRMALGVPGWILGWTPYLKNQVRAKARKSLDKFMEMP
jgi:ketosteroid isomerase-like protein